MKYVITGSTGHISKPLAETLIHAGHEVTVITSSNERVAAIEAMGAKAATGSVTDIPFLTAAFTGADGVYTMVPPKWDAANWKEYIHGIGRNYAAAIASAGVKKVVNLSSVGAHMPEGCGPVSGLYGVEQELNALAGTDVRHLRPGFFYYNFLSNIPMVKHMGIIGGNYGEHSSMAMVHTNDIAAAAAEELQSLSFTSKSVRYVVSDERTTDDVARVLGAAIGKPELPWVNFRDEDTQNALVQAGLTPEVAANYTEMGAAIASGAMMADYQKNKPAFSRIKLEDFATEFAGAYNAS